MHTDESTIGATSVLERYNFCVVDPVDEFALRITRLLYLAREVDSPKRREAKRDNFCQFVTVEYFLSIHILLKILFILPVSTAGVNINALQYETIEDLVENAHGRRATDKTIALLTFHRETSADLTRETDYYGFLKTKNL